MGLSLTFPTAEIPGTAWLYFALFTLLFGFGEFADFYFHDRTGGRWGITVSEAFLAPMIIALPDPLVASAVALAVGVERIALRSAPIKTVFNVASYGTAAIAASATWNLISGEQGSFTIRNALAIATAGLVFAALTHLFTSGVIALAERGNFVEISRAVASTTVVATAGAIFVGLFFAAAFISARWTVFLFPPAFFALYLANRALVRQSQERERVEHLHAATRALAAGRDLDNALLGFLEATAHVVSAASARAVLLVDDETLEIGTNAEGSETWHKPADEHMKTLLNELERSEGSARVSGDDTGVLREVTDQLGAHNLIAIRLQDGSRVGGCLVAAARVGADDFTNDDVRLLEALGHELMLSIDSYRLFQEVADERERFGRIFTGSKEGICLIDATGVVRAWNPTLERLTGYVASEVMGRVWSDVVMLRSKDQQRVEGTALAEVDPDEEFELVSREGPTRWVSVLAGPVQAEGGGWVVLLRDVTAQHEVEQAKSDFLSTISHELRTPLTTIKGSLQVLERNPESLPPDLTRQMIGVTSRGAERLERLVMNLLIVSQIESGTMPLFTDEIHLEEVITERVGTMLRDHEKLVVRIPDEPLVVRADRERLGQALDHVFDNAMKFGREGSITVEVERADGYAHVSVRDEGPGIPAVDRERIFDRFVRLGDVLTRETQGAGVGLFIARESMTAMNGEIWVESTPGKGSTFHLKVPMARPVAVVRSEAS